MNDTEQTKNKHDSVTQKSLPAKDMLTGTKAVDIMNDVINRLIVQDAMKKAKKI